MAIICPKCGVSLPDGAAFCDACGTPLRGQSQGAPQATAAPIGSVVCPVCGAAALPGEAFCDNCGAALLPPTAYTAPVQTGAPAQSAPAPPSYSPAPMSGYAQATPRQITASLVVTSPPPPATIPVPGRPDLIVGRSDPQSNSYPDIDLGPYGGLDLGVSRRHFRLTRNGDQFYVEDFSSMNGTIVNGQRIPPHTLQPLRSGDHVVLGKMELVFEVA